MLTERDLAHIGDWKHADLAPVNIPCLTVRKGVLHEETQDPTGAWHLRQGRLYVVQYAQPDAIAHIDPAARA